MPRKLSEDQTRKQLIDPQLEKAGWYLRDHSKVRIEIPVDGYDKEPWNGVTDYTLYRENGDVLAVVEAKKTAVDVKLAEAPSRNCELVRAAAGYVWRGRGGQVVYGAGSGRSGGVYKSNGGLTMPYNPDIHHRRSIRLKDYDYTQNGAYFVTLVTYQREPLFGKVVNGEMKLNEWGEIARREWFKTAELRPYVELFEDEFVVMPNHAHGIMRFVGAERRSAPTTPDGAGAADEKSHVDAESLGAIVRAYKSAVTYAVNAARQTRGMRVWHRNYYEHIIRDDADLKRIRDYIANNPLKWTEDSLR